jgi:peptide/nickel transport system permease protein
MLKYTIRRLVGVIPVMLGLLVLIALLIELIPGDPAQIMLGQHVSKEALEALRERMGLNRPFIVRFGVYVGNLLRGDWGTSIREGRPILTVLAERIPATFELSLVAMLISTLFGILIGIISAWRQYSFLDYGGMLIALVGISMPVFWLGLMMIYLFALVLPILPFGGRLTTGIDLHGISGFYVLDSIFTVNGRALVNSLKHLIMPSIALGTIPMAIITRMTRSSMLEILRQDYISTARAKGLQTGKIIMKHAFKNAMMPVITVVGLNFGTLLGGAILTETVFAWPGLGTWLLDSIYARDYPAVQGGVLFVGTAFVLINLLVDLSYTWINPKVKYD